MKAVDVVAYFYEGNLHCISCARKRFGKRLNLVNLFDKEDELVKTICRNDDIWQGLFCENCANELGNMENFDD